MSDVALSIVVPTFNTSAMTLATCRAALDTSPPNTELIVVDDASTDNTRELIEAELPNVRVVRLDKNRRFAAAANAGIAITRGSIVLLLNSDAVVEHDALTSLLAAFDNEPSLGIAGARLLNADGTPQWSGGPVPTLAWLTVLAGGFASFLPRRRRALGGAAPAWVSGAAMAFRRAVFDVAGPLREHYRFYAQDLDFCLRARAAGWNVRIVEEARVIHGGGATVRQWRGVEELAHDPSLLWLDLLTWSREHHGIVWATTARGLMIVAALVRVTSRRLRELLLRGDERARSRSTTAAYAAALRQLFVES
ncbi:MAG: glycosyltransferase [Acidobacteria bacterium]|nr:glycosyltransferase [Acidobacteriota bacterium]